MKKINNNIIWSFKDIESEFDQHIVKSIPGYANFWWYSINLLRNFVSNKTLIYDLGCSTGKQTNLIYKNLKELKNLKIVGVDIEKSMTAFAKKRYSNKATTFKTLDVNRLDFQKTNVFLCMFLFNFLDLETREKLLKKINKSLKKGGAVFFADKVINNDSSLEVIINQAHYLWKQNYFTKIEIFEKQEQIRGILKPMKENEIQILFKKTGFKYHLISKDLNFNLYILQK